MNQPVQKFIIYRSSQNDGETGILPNDYPNLEAAIEGAIKDSNGGLEIEGGDINPYRYELHNSPHAAYIWAPTHPKYLNRPVYYLLRTDIPKGGLKLIGVPA